MSDQDDTLLDEDLGDEEYDLGNDEEEALLADDYEIDRQNSYKGEEETDDVLDLGVMDALDDSEGDDENVAYRSAAVSHNPSHCYNDERIDCHGNYYEHEERENYTDEQHQGQRYQANMGRNEPNMQNNLSMGDLREKLQKRDIIVGNGQGMEDDDCEEARERRNRFQNERIMILPKMNSEIPDSLENVVTAEQSRSSFRGRGRGRGIRGIRGGRFAGQMAACNTRFGSRGGPFQDQNPPFRPPLLEARPPIFPNGPPTNMMNPQMIYHQGNPHAPRFQQFQGPPHPPGPHFAEPGPRPPFNPFQGMPHGPRPRNPRMDLRPRPPAQRFNGPPHQQQFMPPTSQHFQGPRPPHGPDSRPMPGPHDGMMQGGPQGGSSLLGPAPYLMGPPQGNLGPAMHPPHQMLRPPVHDGPMAQGYRPPGPNHGQPMGNSMGPPMNAQPAFENRPPFEEQPFDRNVYEHSRPPYNNLQQSNQFNNQLPVGPQSGPAVTSVPLPPGHKILINPHFRGTPQPPSDGRPTWNGSRPPATRGPSDPFVPPTSYQDQGQYAPPAGQPSSQEYAKPKNDDPYAYFSDVWQENKTSKPRSVSPLKSYSGDSNYSRDNNYRDYESKYKSDGRDTYSEESRYRDRSPAPRSRDYQSKSRPHQSNSYHSDTYERTSKPTNSTSRTSIRPPQKRSPETDRPPRDVSPKRVKQSNRGAHESASSESNTHHRTVEELDPEMREYRKKMEEQKRLREKIMQEKENRRKQAALDRQGDSRDQKSTENAPGSKSAPVSAETTTPSSGNSAQAGRDRARVGCAQTVEAGEKATTSVRIVRNPPVTEKSHTANHTAKEAGGNASSDGASKPLVQQSRRVVLQKPLTNIQKVATSIQKKVSNLQKTPSTATHSQSSPPKTSKPAIVQKTAIAGKTVRKVIKEGAPTVRKVVVNSSNTVTKKTIVSQASQRIVLQPNSKSNSVVIDNLTATTSETQIRRMCQGIGTVESITMGDGSATIVFKTHSAAAVFHKKYQRKMIDLSMINVRLVSQVQSTNVSVKK